MNREKMVGIIVTIIVIGVSAASFAVQSTMSLPRTATKEMDFTVSGSNDCLRFLNNSVSIVYVPLTVAANQQWQLTVNCTKMPGGANGYTDIYVYNGYWDKGTNHTCQSGDVYPILSQIQSADYELKGTTTYTKTYSASTQNSNTMFFVMPPGGQATFHITYKQI
jgi:hypothetical protein